MSEKSPIVMHLSRDGHHHSGDFGDSPSLLDYINTATPFTLPAPCGGKGRCGKCRVVVVEGEFSPVTDGERRHLSPQDLARGLRLACLVRPTAGPARVELEGERAGVGNKASLIEEKFAILPPFRKTLLTLPQPGLQDQASDQSRILRQLGEDAPGMPLAVLRKLAGALRKNGFSATLCHSRDRVIAVEAGDTRDSLYGVAVDIGTTTVAAYLMDMTRGENLDVLSALNAQGAFGGDVISRIHYAMTRPEGLRLLGVKILDQIDSMITALARRNGIDPERIYGVSLAANTTMLHLALGLPPENIAAAPFISVTTEAQRVPSRELGLSIAPGALVQVLPSISGYVGADIVAAVLAGGMDQAESPCLLIDIGTNGEIVLGDRSGMVACSTAAGPAFEGAHVRNGVGGVAGAVNGVFPGKGRPAFTTIADAPPLGLCGSGIVDLLALLLRAGIVDETGRMLSRDEAASAGIPDDYLRGMTEAEGEPAFVLVPEEESAVGAPIMMTQKDVREIQLAKAAIAAGIDTLIGHAGITPGEIGTLRLAGGFGSYIRRESAAAIGLIPGELLHRVEVMGNAAGRGAIMALLSENMWKRCDEIRRAVRYIELSSSPEFQDAYIDRMFFPKENTKTDNKL